MVHARRVIVIAIVYVNRDRCACRYLPNDYRPLLWNLSRCCARVRLAWADAGHADKLATWAASLKIVRKRDAHAFEVLALPLGRRAHTSLDHRSPPLRPRLRTGVRRPRGHGPVGYGRPDNTAPRHPEAVTTKQTLT
jgi:hypothetical protein